MPDRGGSVRAPTRSDSLRRREALLEAAWDAFNEYGLAAPLDQIAKRAGVANATLYRHFRDKEELVLETFATEIDETGDRIEDAAEITDPWEAFATVIELLFELQARNRGFGELMSIWFPDMKPAFGRDRLPPIILGIIERAEHQGSLRPGFSLQDLPPLLWANSGVLEGSRHQAPAVWRRYMQITLDGLYARGKDLPLSPPMTSPQTEAAMLEMGERMISTPSRGPSPNGRNAPGQPSAKPRGGRNRQKP